MSCVCCVVTCSCNDVPDFYGNDIFITFGTFTGNGNGTCELSGQTVTLTYGATVGAGGTPGWTGSYTSGSGQVFNIVVTGVTVDTLRCLQVAIEYTIPQGGGDPCEGSMTGGPDENPTDPPSSIIDECDPDLVTDGGVSTDSGSCGPFQDPCKGEVADIVIFS